jgi:hypothetical protein
VAKTGKKPGIFMASSSFPRLPRGVKLFSIYGLRENRSQTRCTNIGEGEQISGIREKAMQREKKQSLSFFGMIAIYNKNG